MIARIVAALAAVVATGGCEACGACVGTAIAERVVAHSDAGPETAACPIPADKQGYVGTWRDTSPTEDFVLAIAADCRVHYRRGGTKVSAPLMSFYGDDFSVGAFGIGTTFRVSKKPTPTGGIRAKDGSLPATMSMTVDGVSLLKTDEAPETVIAAASSDDD